MIFQKLHDQIKYGATRSSKWPSVRKAFLKLHPVCSVCGGKDKITIHHKLPFHLHPELELDPTNFITLCESKTVNCHFVFGHCNTNWKCYNKDVENCNNLLINIEKNAKFDEQKKSL